MPTVSVVVPVYKVEPYLRTCLDSIMVQTYTDFEVILVDDGSPDNCGAICDEYAAKDKRVRVIHQENQGVSAARNLGIHEAQGKNIAFVDSDDAIHPQMYELLVPVLENTDYPFVHCAFHRSCDDVICSFPNRYAFSMGDVQEMTSEEGIVRMMDGINYGHYIWRGLYQKTYIESFLFPLGVRWEDVIWSGEVVGNAGKYGFIPYDLYSYRTNASGLVKTKSWAVYKDYFDALEQYLNITDRLTPSVLKTVRLLVYRAMIYGFDGLLASEKPISTDAQNAVIQSSRACKLSFAEVMGTDYPLRRKLIYLLCMIHFPTGCKLRRMLIR